MGRRVLIVVFVPCGLGLAACSPPAEPEQAAAPAADDRLSAIAPTVARPPGTVACAYAPDNLVPQLAAAVAGG